MKEWASRWVKNFILKKEALKFYTIHEIIKRVTPQRENNWTSSMKHLWQETFPG